MRVRVVGGTDHGPSAFTWVRTTGHWRALGVRIGAGACHLGAKQTILITSARIAPVVASTFAFPANLDCIFTVHAGLGVCVRTAVAGANVAPVVAGTFA